MERVENQAAGASARSERRGFGPLGFALAALVFLLLPTVTVSCSASAVGTDPSGAMTASMTGADVVVGARPDVEVSGSFRPDPDRTPVGETVPSYLLDDGRADAGARAVSIALVVVLGFGVALSLVRWWRLRAVLALVVAVLAAVLLVVAQRLVAADWRGIMRGLGEWVVHLPQARGTDPAQAAADAVVIGIGFWSSLVAVLAVAVVNAVLLVVRRGQAPSHR